MSSIIISIPFNLEKDIPIVEKILTASPISAYIKSLIAKDIGIDAAYDVTFSEIPADPPKSKWFHVRLNTETEPEIIEKLKSVGSKIDYIRTLVNDDINAVRSKSWERFSEEIGIQQYRDSALFAASQFAELSDIMRANGFLAKSTECNKLADILNAWAMHTK